MKAASREAQTTVADQLDQLIQHSDNAVAVAAQVGTELFLIVDQLDACLLYTSPSPRDS